LLHPGTMSLAK